MPKTTTIKNLTDRQTATILASLRYFQANRDDILELELEHFEEVTPLTYEEIDELCESINFKE
jgi:hypothetical protein